MQRDPRLRKLSSDHHHALVLARRLTTLAGDARAVEEARETLALAFERELAPHFRIEEDLLLPALHAAGFSDPIFESERAAGHFTLTLLFHHFLDEADLGWPQKLSAVVDEKDVQLLVFARDNGRMAFSSDDTLAASGRLRRLRDVGLLVQHGAAKQSTWYCLAAQTAHTDMQLAIPGLESGPTARKVPTSPSHTDRSHPHAPRPPDRWPVGAGVSTFGRGLNTRHAAPALVLDGWRATLFGPEHRCFTTFPSEFGSACARSNTSTPAIGPMARRG